MNTCRVIQVIETTLLRRGRGTPEDPLRIITQYWSLDGELLWEKDPQFSKDAPQTNDVQGRGDGGA